MSARDADILADRMLDRARDEDDIRAASLLRQLGRVHDVARKVVKAKTHQQSQAAYDELVELMKEKNT